MGLQQQQVSEHMAMEKDRPRLEEGTLGGHPPDGLHEVGELQDFGQLEPPLGLRRRPLLLGLAPRLGDVVLRLLQRLGALLVQLPLHSRAIRTCMNEWASLMSKVCTGHD